MQKRKSISRRIGLEWLSWMLLIAACVFIIYSLTVYALGEPFASRGFIHSLRMQPPFADLRYLTANAECGVDLNAYYQGLVVGCDPAGRTYRFDYPPMSIWLGRLLDVKGAHTPLIAISVAVSVVTILGLMAREVLGFTWKTRMLLLPMLIGFPLLSAIERGNIDLILFLNMILLAFLLSLTEVSVRQFSWIVVLAFLLVFISVSLKIYPVFGILALLLQSRTARRFQGSLAWDHPVVKIIVVAACLAGLMAAASYVMTVGNLIKEGGLRSHGLMAFGYLNTALINTFGLSVARFLIRLIFLLKFASLAAGFIVSFKLRLFQAFRSSRPAISRPLAPGFLDISVMICASIWLGCYFTTINYDYRYIYIFPLFIAFARIASAPQLTPIQRTWTQLMLASMTLIFLLPMLMVGYTPLGMAILPILEPVTEFLLIPLIAGSVMAFLLAQTIFLPRTAIQEGVA